MSSYDVTRSQFEAIITDHEIVFVCFWAGWCAPCKRFSSVYEAVTKHFPLIQFIKINIEVEVQLADSLEIRSIPHLMVFKEGIVIYSDAGANTTEYALRELAQQAIEFDVSSIRAQLDCPE